MARGNINAAVEAIEEKKRGLVESGDRQRRLYFRLKDGESAVVRFLEEGDELHWAWVHQLPASGNYEWGRKIPCRDQGEEGEPIGARCPGCERGDKRTFQGVVNLIWRNAPVIKRDENNRIERDSNGKPLIDGSMDAVSLWISGITVFEELLDLHENYGLMSRDFLIKRKGDKFNTRYSILPANPDGGAQKLSKKDEALASEKYDLADYVTAPSYDDWGKTYQRKEEALAVPSSDSPFRRFKDT
jgi:hypothetical protein